MERFIAAFRQRAIDNPGSPFCQGLLEAANVMQRCLPIDPPPVTDWVRLDIDDLRGRVKPQATLRDTARP